MRRSAWLHDPAIRFHLALLGIVFLSQFVLSDYLHLSLTRVMVLAVFATGYNLAYGYAGLLSLGHAMFFAAGLYGAALPMKWLGCSGPRWPSSAASSPAPCWRSRSASSRSGPPASPS